MIHVSGRSGAKSLSTCSHQKDASASPCQKSCIFPTWNQKTFGRRGAGLSCAADRFGAQPFAAKLLKSNSMSDYLILSKLTKIYPTPQGPAVIVRDFDLSIKKGE